MNLFGITLTLGLLTSSFAISQVKNPIIIGDTLIYKYYFRNGNLYCMQKYIKGRDWYTYKFSLWNYRNGNPQWVTYYDTYLDTSYSLTGRRNGSIEVKTTASKKHWVEIKQRKNGEIYERSYGVYHDHFYHIETYKHGQVVSARIEIIKQLNAPIDTVLYYRGQIGGSSLVIELDSSGINKYNVNGVEMNEDEYKIYNEKYEFYIRRRTPKHYYKEYTADSVLVYEGVFKGVDLPCGEYIEYYETGIIKTRGYYNESGQMERWWSFYNEQGLFYKTELYKKGKLKQ
jgi:hypothetical protein